MRKSALVALAVLAPLCALPTPRLLTAQQARAEPPAPATAVPLGIDREALPTAVTDVEGVERRIFRDGRVFIAGQPSAEALRRLRELGVEADVNLRTQEEMDNRERVPYDEAALAAELGMEYVHLPIGGDEEPFRPEVLDRLADVLRRHSGLVLLHCTVAWRASNVWVGYLVRDEGLSIDDALARGRAIALSEEPLALLLGRPLQLVYADEAPQPGEPKPTPEPDPAPKKD